MVSRELSSLEADFFVTESELYAKGLQEAPRIVKSKRVKKAAENSLQILKCKLGSYRLDSEQPIVNKIFVSLEYHSVDNRHFFIISSGSKPVLKCDVSEVRDFVELPLQILAHKCLAQEMLVRAQTARHLIKSDENSRSRKKRKVSPLERSSSAALTGKIQSKYRELECSDAQLAVWGDGSGWQLEFDISLRYKQESSNNFAAETNRFLDTLFSDRSRTHFVKHEIANHYVQRQFNHQSTKYTMELDLGLGETMPDIPQLNVRLLPFQKESVRWMLRKEGYWCSKIKLADENYKLEELCELLNAHVSFGYEIMRLPKSAVMFWNKFTGYIISFNDAISIISAIKLQQVQAQGVLSEEMGLGKTLEVLALILTNKRKLTGDFTFTTDANKVIRRAATSLIVCPDSILRQWMDEIEMHVNFERLSDPQTKDGKVDVNGLALFHYKGFQEVKSFFQTDDIATIVEQLATYDIIICSYTTVSAEVHYAEFSAAVRYRRGNAPKYDYSSPLSLLQFYRIILDEVQMLRGESTNAARCAGLLHRVHTWGVSGTPINSITDFKTVLSYLHFHPFQDSAKIVDAVRKNVSKRNKLQEHGGNSELDLHTSLVKGIKFDVNDLMDIFPRFDLCIRHSKVDVSDQICIPKQHNFILPLEFLPIEQDNYMNLWNTFLEASGYQSDGSGRTYLSPKDLNYWLGILRKTCCHALMPKAMLRLDVDQDTATIQTMDAILRGMTGDVAEKIDSLNRENFTLKIQFAQVRMELKNEPMKAVNSLMCVREELTQDLKMRFGVNVSINNSNARDNVSMDGSDDESRNVEAKPYLDLLHQCFFFIATAYYLLGSKKLEAVDDENSKRKLLNASNEEVNGMDNDASLKKYVDVFSDDEMKEITMFQSLEQENYGYAEILRKAILADRIKKVDSEIEEVKTFFQTGKASSVCQLSEIPFRFNEDYSTNMGVALGYKRLQSTFQSLNNQTKQFNNLLSDLRELSYKPLITEYDEDNQDDKAQDYENTIEDQDKVFATLDCLERILSNREEVASADEEIKRYSNPFRNMDTFSDFHIALISDLILIDGCTLKMAFTDLKNVSIVNSFTDSTVGKKQSFETYLLGFEAVIPKIKKEIKLVRENLKKFNEIYNSKTNYFSNLQKISDSLVSLVQLEPASRGMILRNTKDNIQLNENVRNINNLRSRLKYLETLTILKESLDLKKKFNCAICLSEIFMGSMIKCGHFFCRSCIHSWLKNKNACPLCKMETSLSEVYTFKFQDAQPEDGQEQPESRADSKSETQGDMHINDDSQNGNSDNEYPHKYCGYPHLEKIHQLTLKDTYGTKIDFAVKLVLYLLICHQEEVERDANARAPQVIIYSQYSDFLDILSKVLSQHAIKHFNTSGSSRFSKTVEKFKKSPDITCLLLDVKKQATGLTLVNATHVFIMEPIINDSAEVQAVNRTHRIGQTRETYVWNFVVRNTVEQNIVKYKSILEEKKASHKEQRSREMNPRVLKSENSPEETSSSEDEDDEEYVFNQEGDESVSGKHIWSCFFQPLH
ncbi:LANO_0G13982g1_1 [Lachancea nothofagi CBS 11611]|uniref:LANO_0G13982g1_1 n=1 Tax=Lachancea nothofagi CBS 11611 TaxID=1266666 RepID=A0A1G4KKB1_9SACH|nr:LANO_0G13982g1_1 [Lachancea nothofagi CBS 11611]